MDNSFLTKDAIEKPNKERKEEKIKFREDGRKEREVVTRIKDMVFLPYLLCFCFFFKENLSCN